jgi:hydroxymethylpyrimidine pyrophosphatase-like HAD family hydrolase
MVEVGEARGAGGEVGIKLVALDLDGTILERGRLIEPRLVQALRALASSGVRVTTATGRPHSFQVELLPAQGLGAAAGVPHAIVADEREIFFLDGAAVGRPGAVPGRTRYVPHPTWNEAIRGRWHDLHPIAMGWLFRAQQEATRRGWECRPLQEEAAMYDRGLPTLALREPAYASEIHRWLEPQLLEGGVALCANRNGRLVQLHDAIAGKGPVLLELSRYWSIAPSQILAVGDSINDMSMVDGRYGFRCGTTANADEVVKEAVRDAGGVVASAPVGLGVLEILAAHGLLLESGMAAGSQR